MRLANITIINHKSLKNICVPFADNSYVTIIGLNDAGKSTILRSIELFFGGDKNLPQTSEASKISPISNSPLEEKEFDAIFSDTGLPSPDYDSQHAYILAEFKLEHVFDTEEIDSLKPSEHLQYILDEKSVGDSVYILKELGPRGEYFALCDDAANDDGELLQLWNQNKSILEGFQKQHDVKDDQVRNRNKSGPLKNIERALAIYAKMKLDPSWGRYDFKKDRSFFPGFEYLDWNISVDQLQALITTTISPAIDDSIKEIQAAVNKKQGDINEIANKKLEEIYEKYSEYLPKSVNGLTANISIPLAKNATEVFVNKDTSDKSVHIADQGDGIKRQIGLGLIRAIAEENMIDESDDTRYIWVFDEPETHLYPQAQRELAESLSQLSSGKFQIVVSTHSVTFVDKTKLNDVYKAELVNGYTTILSTKNVEDVLVTLGVKNSDFLFYDKFIAVEGPTEYHLLDHFHNILYREPLSDAGARAINLAGKSNSKNYRKILEDILGDYRKTENTVIYLLDKDTSSTAEGVILVGDVSDFEDSLSNEIWIQLLKNECNVEVTSDELQAMRQRIVISDPQTKLHKQLSDKVYSDAGRTCYLNTKGESLANDLRKYITTEDQIPQAFKDAFLVVR